MVVIGSLPALKPSINTSEKKKTSRIQHLVKKNRIANIIDKTTINI